MPMSRRELLRNVGGGLVVGLALGDRLLAAQDSEEERGPQAFELPALGYAYDALEPWLDARTMELHYTKHHQGYVDKANRMLAEYPEWRKYKAEDLLRNLGKIPEPLHSVVRNNVGGHVNHSLFWSLLSPRPKAMPTGALLQALEAQFGSFDAFREELIRTAMTRFGSGWAWLVKEGEGPLRLLSTANQDSPLLFGMEPLLGIDVWEHAYYLKYTSARLEYVRAVLQVLDWSKVDALYASQAG